MSATMTAVTIVLVWLVRPMTGGPAAFDAASSVLYFERIMAGRHLEAFLNTTPKPLLTLVYGVLHAIDVEWRLVSLSAVLATAIGIVLAGEAARRTAGLAAAAFAVVGLTGSASLVGEASWAYGLGWAFLMWMAAALMLLRPDPLYGIAGTFLAVGALARPETFILLGLAVVVLAGAHILGRPLPKTAWRIIVGFVAIPVMGLHDVLLTGDPFYWLAVAPHAVEVNGGRARSLAGTVYLGVTKLWSLNVLVVLATVGGLIAMRRRQWLVAAGLVGLGPLVILATWVLAIRHIEVVAHYLHAVDLAVILGAAYGVGTVLSAARDRLAWSMPALAAPPRVGIAIVAASVIAIASSHPYAPLTPGARSSIASQGQLDARVAQMLPTIRANLRPFPPQPAGDPGPLGDPDPTTMTLFVSRHQVSRIAVDLDVPLTAIASFDASRVDLAHAYPPAGSLVYIDAKADGASLGPTVAPLRVTVPTVVDGVRIVPVKVDPAAGYWIVLVTKAP